MTITTSIPPHLKGDLSYLSHHEAAYGRLRALLDMLSFLAAIPDQGTPSTKVLAGAFTCLEYLAEDVIRLYDADLSQRRP